MRQSQAAVNLDQNSIINELLRQMSISAKNLVPSVLLRIAMTDSSRLKVSGGPDVIVSGSTRDSLHAPGRGIVVLS